MLADHQLEICPLLFKFGKGGCPGSPECKRGDHSRPLGEKKGVCFKDFFNKGSCERSDAECWFSHETPEVLRSNEEYKKRIELERIFRSNKQRKPTKKMVVGNKNIITKLQMNVIYTIIMNNIRQNVMKNSLENLTHKLNILPLLRHRVIFWGKGELIS